MQIICCGICVHLWDQHASTIIMKTLTSTRAAWRLRSNDGEVICACRRQRAENKVLVFLFLGGCAVEGIVYHLV